jgi:hypothetical protein
VSYTNEDILANPKAPVANSASDVPISAAAASNAVRASGSTRVIQNHGNAAPVTLIF